MSRAIHLSEPPASARSAWIGSLAALPSIRRRTRNDLPTCTPPTGSSEQNSNEEALHYSRGADHVRARSFGAAAARGGSAIGCHRIPSHCIRTVVGLGYLPVVYWTRVERESLP